MATATVAGCATLGRVESLPTAATTTPQSKAAPTTAVPTTTTTTTGTPTTTELPTTTTTPPVRPVTIALAGDIHAEGPAAVVATSGLGEISTLLSAADVAVVNLETAIVTSPGAVAEAKTYTFRTDPSVLAGLAASGVDAASMANNHGMDYGRLGLADSLTAKAATTTPAVIGIGATADEAWAPFVTEAGGRSIGVIAATDVLESQSWVADADSGGLASAKGAGEERLVAATAALAEQVDITVVFLHWGRELQVCPTDRQVALANRLAEAGADIIAGSHAHVVQPVRTVGGATVAYGLGNFAWYHSREPSSVTGVLTVTVAPDDTRTTSWQPAKIAGGLPVPYGEAVALPVTGCA